MTDKARAPLSLIVAYLTYRITTEFIETPTAALLGVLAGVAVWLATGRKGSSKDEKSVEEIDRKV